MLPAPASDPDDNTQAANNAPKATAGKKKPKKIAAAKKKKNVAPWTDPDDTASPRSVTPSPPVHNGVSFADQEMTPPMSEPELEKEVALDEEFGPTLSREMGEMAALGWDEEAEDAAHGEGKGLFDELDEEVAVYEEPEMPIKQAEPERQMSPIPRPSFVDRPRNFEPASPPPAVSPPAQTHDLPMHRARPDTSRRTSHTSDRLRRESATMPNPPPPRHRPSSFLEPANPPHLMQNHYFSLPGLDYGNKPTASGKAAGSEHYCCTFDSFTSSGDAASAGKARDALLVGWEGGLDVYRVLKEKLEIVGRLEGLRGGVVGAKVLPRSIGGSAWTDLRPLIAVIVHGRVAPNSDEATVDARKRRGEDDRWQTTVEVYSLQSQTWVATLYTSASVSTAKGVPGSLPEVPEPVGDLRIDAKGKFITVASGTSGEVHVFTAKSTDEDEEPAFRCIGKYWTTLQSRLDAQIRPSTAKDSASRSISEPPTAPLLSLSGRWLVTVPPNSSSKIAMHAQVAPSLSGQSTPGGNDHVAPAQPNPSIDVVGLNAEGVLARYSRQAAQEILKVSRMGIEMGKAGWSEFTQPSPPNQNPQTRSQSSETGFPPAQGNDDDKPRTVKEPAVVAIIDLERLAEAAERGQKSLPPYLATFLLEDGCNFVSLSGDGLQLLTTSRTGEASHVWDLRHVAHGSTDAAAIEDGDAVTGPHVRRVHGMVRNTQSVVVDAIWARDDNFVALLTTHGTVHLNEITKRSHDEQKRRRRNTATTSNRTEKAAPVVGVSHSVSPPGRNGFLGGLRSWGATVSSQVNTIRSTTSNVGLGIPTTFAGFREATGAGAAMGSRAVARGISTGYSVAKTGMGDMWHADDNKIRRKELVDITHTGAIRWQRGRSGLAVAVTCGGKVYVYPVQRVTRLRGDTEWTGLKAEKAIKNGMREFTLPNITTHASRPSTADSSCIAQGPHGFWSLRPSSTSTVRAPQAHTGAEGSDRMRYETNPPYCPFYIDRRVSMYTYDPLPTTSSSQRTVRLTSSPASTNSPFHTRGYGAEESEPWCFGAPLPSLTKLNDATSSSHASFASSPEPDDEPDTEPDALLDFSPQEVISAAEQLGGFAVTSSEDEPGVQSRLMVNPATSEIRIQSSVKIRAKKGRGGGNGGGVGKKGRKVQGGDGGFDMLDEDQDEFS
ncbi:hypothetical protein B0A48_02193 [Cryoendolithus antarcticus]|uniref:BCAS3 domain-containing protein n=1 Tax=Cryoendolithus antarcticus TaxID=1507870 RepID=A0A1V8TMW8_9PEZI|nr:hypothetical protein B0A48_02193 [Cryoendolithus antarcticus]